MTGITMATCFKESALALNRRVEAPFTLAVGAKASLQQNSVNDQSWKGLGCQPIHAKRLTGKNEHGFAEK